MVESIGEGNAVEVELDALVNLKLNLEDLHKQIDKIAEYLSKKITESSKTALDDAHDDAEQSDATDVMSDEEKKSKRNKSLSVIQSATSRIADIGVGFIKKTFGLVEDIYAKLKAASPLLQAVEQLFNLAWTLFFMPLGNKLAEELIPAVLTMMDKVVGLWDAFEGMTLGEAFAYAIKEGVNILGSFFMDIGSQLEAQGGFIGSIGHMLDEIGSLIKYHGSDLLNTLFNLAEFLMWHIREIISIIIGFKASSLAIQAAQLSMQIASYVRDVANSWNIVGTAVAGVATAGLVAGATTYALTAYADGGYVPATPGGQLAIVGEGGEGEYIIPESKVGQFGGNSYTININGITSDELKTMVRDVVSDEISGSRLRSGF